MTVALVAVAIDAVDVDAVGRFWAEALGWDLRRSTSGGLEVVPTDGVTAFRLLVRPGAGDKVGPNPIHFDLTTTSARDQQESAARFLANGGRAVDVGQRGDEGHVVLADPDGNELCLIEPGNGFLSSCPRLGAVNADGTRALGHFFSAVLGWPLVWDQDEETAIQAPEGTGPKLTWSGPPLMPKSPPERIHLHLAATGERSVEAALADLLRHGATRRDPRPGCPGAIALADVDGNELCLVESTSAG